MRHEGVPPSNNLIKDGTHRATVFVGPTLKSFPFLFFRADSTGAFMEVKVMDVAVRQCYRFNCPNCGSRLEADCGDLVDIGGKTSRFWCPVCRKERYVPWSALRKRVVYEDKSAE